jgi:hypothetical protein
MALPVKRRRHINALELAAVYKALKKFRSDIAGKTISIRMDSRVALSYVKRGTGRCRELRKLARRIAFLAHDLKVTIVPKFIPGSLNVLADRQSRLFESALLPEVADMLGMKGPASIPFPRTGTVMREAHLMSNLKGSIVTPDWPSAPWFPSLCETARQAAIIHVALSKLDPSAFAAKSGRLVVWNMSPVPFQGWVPFCGLLSYWFPPSDPSAWVTARRRCSTPDPR